MSPQDPAKNKEKPVIIYLVLTSNEIDVFYSNPTCILVAYCREGGTKLFICYPSLSTQNALPS